MKILSDAEDIKDIPSLEIVQKLISEVVAKTVPCDDKVITENYKLGTDVQTALSNLLTYTYVNASGISQLSTSLQSAWNTINSLPDYTGGSGIVVSGSVIGHSNNLTAEGTVNTGEIQTPDFGENATLTWFRYDKQGHVTFTGSGGIKIPTADTTLSSTSTRPISSKAVYDNLTASVIRATAKTVGSGEATTAIYENVQKTLEGFQSHIYKLHTDITSLGSNVGSLNTYKDSINISAGSKTVPVYFNNGVPTVCQYTLGSMCKESADDYLPIKGGTLTGKLTVNSDIVIPTAKAVADNSVPLAGSLATITNNDFTQLKNYKSIIGSVTNTTNDSRYNVISVRHRNGYNDGSNYGMYLYSNLTSSGDLIWNKQTAASTWQGERTIIDSGNYTTYFKNSVSNIAGTGLEYVEGTDSSGKSFMKINHKKGSKSGSIGPEPVTYTPNFGETFDVGYAQYDDTGHIIMSSTATIKLPEYSALKNPYALTIQGNGTKLVTYDGAGPVTLNITPSSIGAASSSHTHSYLPLSGGTVTGTTILSNSGYLKQLKINRTDGGLTGIDYMNNNSQVGAIGFSTDSKLHIYNSSSTAILTVDSSGNGTFTGSVTATKFNDYILGAACAKGVDTTAISKSSNLITSGAMYTALSGKVESTSAGVSTALNKLSTGTAIPVDEDYYISQYSGGGTTTTTYHRRPVSALYSYMKKKMDSVYLPLSGNASSATKWATARNINGMSVNGTANRVNYGTCSTAAATAAKVVACTGFALVTGAEITVKFTVTNTVASPTLNVNGTGAKAIYYRGSAITASYLAANRTYTFRYNGTQYDLVGDINTDANNYVSQVNTTENLDYRVLLSNSANDTNEISLSRKSAKLTFNPSTGELKKTGDSPINSSYGMQLCSMYADMAIASKQITMTYEQFSKHNLLLWTLLEDDSNIYHEGIIPVKYLISNGSWEVHSSSNGSLIVRFTIKTDTSSNSKVYFQTYSSKVNLKIYSLI